ncbi:MAG: hypothetical protein ACRBN8_25210 [Nannocystales bacterium]
MQPRPYALALSPQLVLHSPRQVPMLWRMWTAVAALGLTCSAPPSVATPEETEPPEPPQAARVETERPTPDMVPAPAMPADNVNRSAVEPFPPPPVTLERWTGRSGCTAEVLRVKGSTCHFAGWLSAYRTLIGKLSDQVETPPDDEEAARVHLCEGRACEGDPPWLVSTGGTSARAYHLVLSSDPARLVILPGLALGSYGRCGDSIQARAAGPPFTVDVEQSSSAFDDDRSWCWTYRAEAVVVLEADDGPLLVRVSRERSRPGKELTMEPPAIAIRDVDGGWAISACGGERRVSRGE